MLCYECCLILFVFFKQKTAYDMRISDWSSDGCSSDLGGSRLAQHRGDLGDRTVYAQHLAWQESGEQQKVDARFQVIQQIHAAHGEAAVSELVQIDMANVTSGGARIHTLECEDRSEEHTSELQSLMSISYAVFCLKK